MKRTLMATVAAAALIAGTTLVAAQGMDKGGAGAAPAAAPPAAGSGPGAGAPAGGAMNRGGEAPAARGGAEVRPDGGTAAQDKSGDGMKGQQNQRAQDKAGDGMKGQNQRAQDKAGDGMKGGNERAQDNNARQPDSTKAAGDRDQTRTQGQAGGAARITTEQRTEIRTVIKQQNVRPVTNVNFSISVGTRVPRGGGVTLVALPAPVIAIYPQWRGYEYFVVGDDIIVVDPRTDEIVAVLPA